MNYLMINTLNCKQKSQKGLARPRKECTKKWFTSSSKETSREVLHFLHKLEQLHNCSQTAQFLRGSPGNNVILNDLRFPGAVTITHFRDVHLLEHVILSKVKRVIYIVRNRIEAASLAFSLLQFWVVKKKRSNCNWNPEQYHPFKLTC